MSTRIAQERYKDKRTLQWRRRTSYAIWYGIVQRCYDPLHPNYDNYGLRGINVHEEWLYSPYSKEPRIKKVAFSNFVRDVGLRPSQHVSLDRIQPDGDYCPGNVRWASRFVQARNKRLSLYVPDPEDPTGEKKIPVAELAERLGISYQKLRYRLKSEGRWPGD